MRRRIPDDWISRDALARELSVTPDTLGRWEARREGPPCTRIGRKILYRRASVRDWLRAQEQTRPTRRHRGRK
ncbi:MAG: helix-turn-helix domain-containing protein [Roseovarius sp.]|nr:helix-turn-helix domain-containing protein [Roseovarius sp.]